MLWTHRLTVAGLILAAQIGVVVVLAQCWQSSRAANPPCSVSCRRDAAPETTPEKSCPAHGCPSGAVTAAPLVPPTPASYDPAPVTEPATVPAPVNVLMEKGEVNPSPAAITPAPMPAVDQVGPPNPVFPSRGTVAATEPETRPLPPPSRLEDPDAAAVMPTPIAPPVPAAPVAKSEPIQPLMPVEPEMKPVEPVAASVPAPPPPPVQEPLPPAEPPVQIVTPTAPQPLPPSTKQTASCPWTLRIENIDGHAHLEARNGKEVQFRVVCSELDVQAPRGYIQAVGDVVVNGHELHGTCKKLTINWHDEHVQLDGGVDLRCRKNGEEIEVKGEKLTFRLSVISAVGADTPSDSPVRRAVIE